MRRGAFVLIVVLSLAPRRIKVMPVEVRAAAPRNGAAEPDLPAKFSAHPDRRRAVHSGQTLHARAVAPSRWPTRDSGRYFPSLAVREPLHDAARPYMLAGHLSSLAAR